MAEDNKSMDNLKKYALAVFFLAIVVLMFIAVVGQFSKTLRTTTQADGVTFTMAAVNASVSVGTTGLYPFLQTVTGCINGTNTTDPIAASLYTVNEGTADGGTVKTLPAGSGFVGDTANCTITYLANSGAQSSADDFNTGLAVFGTFAGIIVLAIIGMVIVQLYRKEGDGF